MAELDPDQEAALRRLRATFGFVVILEAVFAYSRMFVTCAGKGAL
jgi:hypothetical protein